MKFHPLLLPVLLIFTGCMEKKELPDGRPTSVEGILVSEKTGLPLKGIPISVTACRYESPSNPCQPFEIPQNTVTDKDGYFIVNFLTAQGGRAYAVVADPDNEIVYDGQPFYFEPGRFHSVKLTAKEKNVLRINLKVRQNPYDTLTLTTGYERSNVVLMKGRQIDTAIYARFKPGFDIDITLFPPPERPSTWQRIYREKLPSVLSTTDTLTHNIVVNNPNEFPFE